MRHKAGKENETQTKHTGRNIVIAVVVVLAAFCAYAAALVHSAMVIKDEVTQSVGVVRDSGIGAALAVVPEFLRTLVFARPRGDDQFADCTFSPSLDMSR